MMQALPAFAAALTVFAYSICGEGGFSLAVIAGVTWAAASFLMGVLFQFRPAGMNSNRVWGAVGLAFLLTASVVVTRWPIRFGPIIYRAQFQALADSVAAGHPFDAPRRIGPFTFYQGEVERGFVCLWTDLDPKGRSGYIRGSTERGVPFNVWSVISAGSGWHFLVED
jgi:hypothetical protein